LKIVRLQGLASISAGEMRRVELNGLAICVVHSDDGSFYAVSDNCTHEEVSLSTGWAYGCEIECPRHNSIFSLRTGEALSLPAELPLQVFEVSVEGTDLLLSIG
jgi:3-phenylpropionate/trans-cinnamate dioxygenase ferredoxin subunit